MAKHKFLLRTRFGKDIVSEFLPPVRPSKKAIILCGGLPSSPSKSAVMNFLSEKGYWVFFPRYRGTWESGGEFLKLSPHKDVSDVVKGISKGFTEFWSGKKYSVKNPTIYVIGSSFGGAAAILASQDTQIKKVIALSPVIDWRVKSDTEPLPWLEKFLNNAYGEGYRFSKKDWRKLGNGSFFNPITKAKTLNSRKIFIIHAKDDEVTYARLSKEFSKINGCALWLKGKGGHLSLSEVRTRLFWKKIKAFLDK